jgi:hypothetical protein
VSYTVTALKPIPQVREAAPGSGGLCGSIFLNRIFERHMQDRFEGNRDWNGAAMDSAMEQFDSKIKRRFDGDLNKNYVIRVGLADDRRAGLRGGMLQLSGRDVRDLFEPVIGEIIRLVRGQIRATRKRVSAVLLVGGFGSNRYLYERLQDEFGNRTRIKNVMNRYVLYQYTFGDVTGMLNNYGGTAGPQL